MDQDENIEVVPQLKENKDLCFTGAHVDGLTSENVITPGSKQGKFVVQPVILNVYLCSM